jgi:hypothetical protein
MHLFCDTVETSPLTGWWSTLACVRGWVGATVNPGDDDEDDDEEDDGDAKEGGNIDPDEDEGYGDDEDDDDEEPLRVVTPITDPPGCCAAPRPSLAPGCPFPAAHAARYASTRGGVILRDHSLSAPPPNAGMSAYLAINLSVSYDRRACSAG